MNAIEFYSEIAADFHASYQSDTNRLERIRIWEDFLNRYAVGVAFAYDVGCGSGVLACAMAKRGIETVGIDGAVGMLAIAEKTASESGLSNLSFQQEELPIANPTGFRQADIVISSSTIEYLDSIPESLRFMRNLLKERGVLIFSVSNRDAISRKVVRCVHRLTGRPRYLGFLRHFVTVKETKAALEATDLRYLEHAYFGCADWPNRLLAHFLPPRLTSNMIIVVATRE